MFEPTTKENYSADWLLGKMKKIVPATLQETLEAPIQIEGPCAHFTVMRQLIVSEDAPADAEKRAALYEGVLDDFRKLSKHGPPREMLVRVYPRERLFDSDGGVRYLRLRIRFSFLYDERIFDTASKTSELFVQLLGTADCINSREPSKVVIVTLPPLDSGDDSSKN